MHIQGNLAWMISELLFPCSEPENNEPWLIDPQHSTAKKWDGPQQVSIPIYFPISTMHQVLYDPTCVVRECFFPLCSRNLPNIQIRSNQSIRPEQFSINWNRPKLPLHIQKYPGIKNTPIRMLAKTCIRYCQPETTHRTLEVTKYPTSRKRNEFARYSPISRPKPPQNTLYILSYPGTTFHRSIFFSNYDKSRVLSPIALGP